MPKRLKDHDDEDKIQRKIRRLERKLRRKRRESPQESPVLTAVMTASPSPTPELIVPAEDETPAVEESAAVTAGEDANSTLDETVLMALGESIDNNKAYGAEVHTEIIKRNESILVNGIKKEVREELIKKNLIPVNAKLLDAPKMNMELQGLLSEAIKSRDKRIEERQQQLGSAIAALLNVTNSLVKDDFQKLKVIGTLSDTARLLSDLHHEDTITRRKLIAPNLEKSIANSLESVNRDSFLFGEKFNENVKTASAIKKSATSILKPNSATTKNQERDRSQTQKKFLGNYRAPPRSGQYKQGGGKYQQYQQRTSVRPQQRRPAKPYHQKPVRQT